MQLFAWCALVVFWFAWGYPFIFRAPHKQKRESITVIGPTRVGLLLEGMAILLAFAFRIPEPPGFLRVVPAVALGVAAAFLSWNAVAHLGKQFRVHAGLYVDHELVQSGAYSIVRHPIYTSLLAMLLCTLLLLTPWGWALLCIAMFTVGTEIRVRCEDQLLESRFGEDFHDYRSHVRAYVPFVR